MRAKSAALLVLALGCGLVASFGIMQVLGKQSGGAPAASGDMETIFVAMKDVQLGDMLTSEALRLEQWPKDKVPAGALTQIEDVEGRRTKTRLYAGEAILQDKLFRKGGGETKDGLIPKGYRAVALKVDAVSGIADMLAPGSRVDVMVYLQVDPKSGILETTARCILQDIKVFAVGDVVTLDGKEESKKTGRDKTVSLLVTPDQAAKLTLATEMGRIRLVMRSPEDDQTAKFSEAGPNQLLGRSDVGRRENESLVEPASVPAAVPGPGWGQKLFGLLAAAKAKADAAPTAPDKSTNWTMRIFRPGGIDQIDMEAEAADAALARGPAFWNVHGARTSGQPAPEPKGAPGAAKHAPNPLDDPTPPTPRTPH